MQIDCLCLKKYQCFCNDTQMHYEKRLLFVMEALFNFPVDIIKTNPLKESKIFDTNRRLSEQNF